MSEIVEIVQTIERLQDEFEDLAVRGLRACGPEHLTPLQAIREEFERIGASHVAGRIAALTDAIRNDDRGAAAALLGAQATLRVFERILTLESAGAALQAMLAAETTGDD